MHNSLPLSIADIPVTLRLDGCDAPTRAHIAERYAAFVAPTSTPALSLALSVEPGPAYIPFETNGVWQIHTSAHNGRIEFESHLEKGWVERTAGNGALVMRPQGDPENFLRVLYAWLCLERDALLLHACGVIREGHGYVFFGPSGSGKTTTARLSQAHTILSDDLVIIKNVGAGSSRPYYRVFGVPFRGDLPEAPRTNDVAELRGVFALVKDTAHRVRALSAPQAVARLAACVPFVMAQPAPARRVVEICTDLAAKVPVRALHFSRDDGFWRVI